MALTTHKLVAKYGWGKWGWTETWYYTTQGGSDDARLAAIAFSQTRVQAFGRGLANKVGDRVSPVLEAIRIEDITTFATIGLGLGGSYFILPPTIDSTFDTLAVADNVETDMITELADATKIIKRSWMVTGMPDAWLTWLAQGGNKEVSGLTAWNAAMYGILTRKSIQQNQAPRLAFTGNFALRHISDDPTTTALQLITKLRVDPTTGFLIVTVANEPLDPFKSGLRWTPGTWVVVAGTSDECVKGLSGPAKVHTVATATPSGWDITLCKQPSCPFGLDCTTLGSIRLRRFTYPSIAYLTQVRVAFHKRGSAFFGTRGRRRRG